MSFKNLPIRRKLMTILMLISGTTLLLTCLAFIGYEYVTFRSATVSNLATLGRIIANNSTAALAFDNPDDAQQVLAALRTESHVVAAGLYDSHGTLFARYAVRNDEATLPSAPGQDGYRFDESGLVGLEPVREGGNRRLGTLYLRSDLDAFHEQLALSALIAAAMTAVAFLVAYVLSRVLQQQISGPVQVLASAAHKVSQERDYSVRARKVAQDELGSLTDAFNQMLEQIQAQDRGVRQQLVRLDLLQRITRAIGERQDLHSIFQVVIRRLEDNLSIDFGCIGLYDSTEQILTVTRVGTLSRALALDLALTEQARIPIDRNGLGRCVHGELVYEPDISGSSFPFPQRLAQAGLRALVIAPLLAAGKVVGVLIVARRAGHSFESGECEFLRQLSEHVGLAAQQVKLYDDLQRSYQDLRQSQGAVLQQERLRALGQMASGVAHDINNAISPVALYAESLLDREPGLSDRVRQSLAIILQCIQDVAGTVSRMRDFYRKREAQIVLGRVDLNQLAQGVIELTRSRWKDVPQERGSVIDVRTELAEAPPQIMGAENEIRDALTNLILNAVDAMPEGGVLTVRTRLAPGKSASPAVYLEVTDTGLGMDEEIKRHCLEPFFTTKGERGTGMGLAMVYGMIERHSADLEIDSAPGQGTTVRLIFPLPATVEDATVQQPALPSPTTSIRILIVDDDPLIIESLSETLRGDGHEVTAADGGQAGVDAFLHAQQQGNPFAVVITDLGMPYIDGRRVAAAVKAASPATPVILLTGWGQQLTAENDIPPHVDKVLNKPPRLRELRVALADLRGVMKAGR